MIEIACPKCAKGYRLADKFAGKKVKCKQCGQNIQIKGLPPGVVPERTPPPMPSPTPSVPASPATASPAPTAPKPLAANVQPAAVSSLPPGIEPLRKPVLKSSANQTLRGSTSNLQYEISQRPDFSIVKVEIPQGQQIFAEPSAMVSMTPTIHLKAGFKGGLGKTFGRLLGGESLIMNTFTAEDGPGEILFAGGAAGDVTHHALNGGTLYLQRGAYMFNTPGVEVSGKWQGAKGFFSGEGLVLLKASGVGDLFFNSYGAIMPIDVTDGFIVDTGYIVAFEESLQYTVTVLPGLRAAGKIKSFFFGGEGLVCQFSGTGRVWVQTRQAKSFLSWVHAFRPVQSKG